MDDYPCIIWAVVLSYLLDGVFLHYEKVKDDIGGYRGRRVWVFRMIKRVMKNEEMARKLF